nr:adenylyltransferase/cytidyltransferase family protein [Comamonas jiangduensis]
MPHHAPHTAVLIGRFQPFHLGHLALLQQALQTAQQVVVVLGSAFQARSPKNPFTWQERATLIRSSLPAADVARVHCVPVRDYYDEPRWVQAVMAAVPQVPLGVRVALVGHFKDDSSNYLARFPGWELLSLPRQGDFDAPPRASCTGTWAICPRRAMGTAHPTAARPVAEWLRDWQTSADYTALRAEWRMLSSYHAAWASAPIPRVCDG